jgi:glycosyltransferase involved in cell wall biosynthesis
MQIEISGAAVTCGQHNSPAMRVTVADPPAYTPPYDHALCEALGGRGLDVTLATSRFRFGAVAPPRGYRREECFYRLASSSAIAKGLQHGPDMLGLARRARGRRDDVVHFQWFPIPALDRLLVRRFPHPVVLTAHDITPREVRAGARGGAMALLRAVDAVVVHSDAGRRRLVGELGVPGERVHVIPHGAFDRLAQSPEGPQPEALAGLDGRRVVLFFGLVRPYKGVDLLVEAFAATPDDAVLLVVGMPRMPTKPLERRARELGIADRVRLVPRYVPDSEVAAFFRRADLVALPYREIEQSGVLYTALAFGKPLLLSAVGGFPEIAARGAARLVEPGSVASLSAGLVQLLDDEPARRALGAAGLELARAEHSWPRIAELHEALYRHLLGGHA